MRQRSDLITVGVPVYRGEETLGEALRSIQRQTYDNLDVVIAVDGSDERSADCCKPFLGDSRFRLHTQQDHLGWAGNLNTLMLGCAGDFFCYHAQDDLTSPNFFSALHAAARGQDSAAICYADMQCFGIAETLIRAPSITGDSFSRLLRQIELLESRPFLGLVRREAIRATNGIKIYEHDSFAADMILTTELALWGDIVHVPGPVYYKRMTGDNLHLRWNEWESKIKRDAWVGFGAGLLEAAVPAGRTVKERDHLFYTVLNRLLSSRGQQRWTFIDVDSLGAQDRRRFINDLFKLVQSRGIIDLSNLLGRSWDHIIVTAFIYFGIEVKDSTPKRSCQKRQAILVAGMHRSGTSALAGTVHALGAAAPKTLMAGGARDNPRGYWESLPLVEVHDQLLASAGSSWHDWRPLDVTWSESTAALRYRDKIKQVITEEFAVDPFLVIKDPRICRFVQFFASTLLELGVEPIALLPIRNPLEVAYSLNRRNGMALPKGLLLWLRHVLDAERDTRQMRRCFIAYENLLTDWRLEIARTSELTGLAWPERSGEVDAKVDAFLTHELHHEKAPLDGTLTHPDVSSWIREAYRILSTFTAEGETKDLIGKLDRVRARFDGGSTIFGAAAAAEELAAEDARVGYANAQSERQQLRADLQRVLDEQRHVAGEQQRAAAETAELRTSLASAQDDNRRLTTDLQRVLDEQREVDGEVQRARAETAALRAALVSAHDDNRRLTGDLQQTAIQSEKLNAMLLRRSSENQDLAAARDVALAERESARAERDSSNALLEAIFSSRSWRMTAPVRQLRRWLRG